MQARNLGVTGIVTSILGFGCASLFHLPRTSERRRMLEVAFDAGIRHFDVAPIYGLGRAEPELARFFRQRRTEITVASKFGMQPTVLGRAAGFAQAPVRAALRHKPQNQVRLQRSGRGPEAGLAGRLLYRNVGHTRSAAHAGLNRSLRALRTDYLDVFLLHEPAESLVDTQEMTEYLEGERGRGRIRAWGTAGESDVQAALLDTLAGSQVIQHRDNILDESNLLTNGDGLGHISFGVLAQVLAPLRELLAARPPGLASWNEMSGCDLTEPGNLVSLLLRQAVSRNTSGPVVFSTTRADRLEVAVRAVQTEQSESEGLVMRHLADALRLVPETGVVS
jgi:D-threo-aldose 1-dehydrogenase